MFIVFQQLHGLSETSLQAKKRDTEGQRSRVPATLSFAGVRQYWSSTDKLHSGQDLPFSLWDTRKIIKKAIT